jgi:tRNA (uracil-5-)-methyltransferase TRM9
MDLTTAHELIELNNRFYTEHATSFSATRSAPWEGWNHAAELLTQLRWPRAHNGGASCHSPLVLDLACGNLRFERFFLNAFPSVDLRFHAVDACADLAKDASQIPGADFYEMDVLGSFLDDWARLGDLGHTVPNRRRRHPRVRFDRLLWFHASCPGV